MIHVALLAIMGLQTKEPFFYKSPDGSVVISGISVLKQLELNKITGVDSAGGTGNPAQIQLNSMGIAMTAQSVAGKAQQTDTVTYLLESHSSGDTKVVMDSSVAKAFQLKSGKPAPKATASASAYKMELDTDKTDYAGAETEGKLTIPSAFEFHGHVDSSKDDDDMKRPIHTRSVQEFSMHGTSGILNVDPRPGMGVQAIKDGVFEGPITFSGTRVTKDLVKKTQTISKLQNGSCDRVRILTDEHGETIVFEGHVSFDLEDESGSTHVPDAKAFRFLFDPDLNPVSIDGDHPEMSVSIKG